VRPGAACAWEYLCGCGVGKLDPPPSPTRGKAPRPPRRGGAGHEPESTLRRPDRHRQCRSHAAPEPSAASPGAARRPLVILLAGNSEYAVEVFQLEVVHFWVKPVDCAHFLHATACAERRFAGTLARP